MIDHTAYEAGLLVKPNCGNLICTPYNGDDEYIEKSRVFQCRDSNGIASYCI